MDELLQNTDSQHGHTRPPVEVSVGDIIGAQTVHADGSLHDGVHERLLPAPAAV